MRLISLIVLLSSLAFAQGQFSGGGGAGSGGTTITNTNVATNDVACWDGAKYINCRPGQAQNVQAGTTYTIVSTDNAKVIQLTNVAAKTITVPDATTAGFESGFFVDVCNANTGAATFNRSSTNTIDGATSTSLAAATTTAPVCFRLNSDGANWRTSQRGSSSGGSGSTIGTVYGGICTGVAGSNITGSFSNVGGQGSCNASVNTGSLGIAAIATRACTLTNLFAKSGANGTSASDGVIKVWIGAQSGAGSATTLTCTIGTSNTCSDTTHTAAVSAGQMIEITFDSAVSSTLTYMSAAVECD